MSHSPFATTMTQGRALSPDASVKIDYFVSEEADVCVMHDRPFSKELSWIEYDVTTSRLELIMEDGDIRDYGIPVAKYLKPYFMNTQIVHVIQLNTSEQTAEDSVDVPLIIHQG